jgi:hypothetical protein
MLLKIINPLTSVLISIVKYTTDWNSKNLKIDSITQRPMDPFKIGMNKGSDAAFTKHTCVFDVSFGNLSIVNEAPVSVVFIGQYI